jgi:hypothetical protein
MMPAKRTLTTAILVALLIGLFGTAAGCSQPRTLQLQTMADPEFSLPAADSALIHVAVVRIRNDGDELEATPITRERLTLPERNLLASVERGLRSAGFPVVSRSEAEYILYCSTQTVSGERQVYRRVPVHETTYATIHGRRGFRTFHGTTTSEVVVPETRTFTHRIITLTAHLPAIDDDDWPKPDDESALWMGRIIGDASDVDEVTPLAVADLLRSWGSTERRTVRVRDLVKPE